MRAYERLEVPSAEPDQARCVPRYSHCEELGDAFNAFAAETARSSATPRVKATPAAAGRVSRDPRLAAGGLVSWPSGRTHYLQDAGVELFGIKLWGTPWQPWFHDWAFNAPRRDGEAFLASKFELIPDDTDIVVCHGPPRGLGDHSGSADGQPHVGSTALTETLERIQPRLMVCGHIHSGYGRYRLGPTEVINAALVDNSYRPVNGPVMVQL